MFVNMSKCKRPGNKFNIGDIEMLVILHLCSRAHHGTSYGYLYSKCKIITGARGSSRKGDIRKACRNVLDAMEYIISSITCNEQSTHVKTEK